MSKGGSYPGGDRTRWPYVSDPPCDSPLGAREREEKQFAYHRDAAQRAPWTGTDAYGKTAETPKQRAQRLDAERLAARQDPRQKALDL